MAHSVPRHTVGAPTTTAPLPPKQRGRAVGAPLLYTLFLAYICTGIISILPGASILLLARNTHVSLGIAGWSFTGSAFGFILGALLAGTLTSRVKAKYLLVIGLALLSAAGVCMPLAGTFPLLLLAQLTKGFGFGFIDVSINTIATLAFAETLGENLNNIHSSYGVGALLGPLLLSFSLQILNTAFWAYCVGACFGLAAILLLLRQRLPALPHNQQETQKSQGTAMWAVLRRGLLWLLALQIAFYVGAEIGFGNWIVTAVSQSAALSLAVAAPVATFFSLGLTAGRVAGGQILKRAWMSERQLLYISIFGGALSGLLVAFFPGILPVSFGASALVGFFYGPLFPGIMAMASRAFVHALGLVSSVMLISTGICAMILPALMGLLLAPVGVHWVMLIPALSCLAIVVPLLLANRLLSPALQARAHR